MYLAYALFCEGASDYSYFEVLVPRVIESTVLKAGRTPVDVPERPSLRLGRKGRSVEAVAREACDGREAFHVVFAELGLPAGAEQAEAHLDPKGCLHSALRAVRGPRGSRGDSLLPAIAQRQSMEALRRSASFQELERSLHTALGDLGILET